MYNPWFSIAFQAVRLTWDAQHVVALRLTKLARGGPEARTEATGMITEKVAALSQAQTVAAMAVLSGASGARTATKVLRVYKGKVRANKRRLSK